MSIIDRLIAWLVTPMRGPSLQPHTWAYVDPAREAGPMRCIYCGTVRP